MVAMLVCREPPRLNIIDVGAHRVRHDLGHVAVLLDELRGERLELTDQVGDDQKLAVAVRPCPDAQNRDRELPCDEPGDLGRNGLEEEHLRTGLLDRQGVLDQEPRRVDRPPLRLVPTELPRALRGQADMPADDDPGVEDRLDPAEDALPPFELDPVDPGLLQEPPSVTDRLLIARLIAHERHVTEDERVRSPAPDRFAMDDALVHRHRDRPLIPVHTHPEGIPDEEHVHPRRLGELGGRIVVGGQPSDLLPRRLHLLDRMDAVLLLRHIYLLDSPPEGGRKRLHAEPTSRKRERRRPRGRPTTL